MRQLLYVLSTVAFFAAVCPAQSLGDLARAERLRRATSPSTRRVITNDDIASAPAPETPSKDSSDAGPEDSEAARKPLPARAAEKEKKPDAKEVQQTIRVQKQKVLALEAHVKQVQDRLDYHEARESPGAGLKGTRVLLQGQGVGHSGVGLCDTSAAMYTNPYKDWCEEPERLKADLEKTQAELVEERGKLEAMQEAARKAGFGSVIYDPD